ncbi:MAG TPA: hypothetical protein PLF40_23715 [Kofleriaceae bacterium]|nr:hypothetical protein [Kofleriaceae bacterium]
MLACLAAASVAAQPATPVAPPTAGAGPVVTVPTPVPVVEPAPAPALRLGIVALPSEVPSVSREQVVAALQRKLNPNVEPTAVRTSLRSWIDGAPTQRSRAQVAALQQELAQSWRAYLSVSLDTAATGLTTVIRAALPLTVTHDGRALFVDALLRLGIVNVQRPDASAAAKQAAQDGIALALRLEPNRTLSLSEFSPDVVDLVEAIRKAPVEQVELRVRSATAVQLNLDGVEFGALAANSSRTWPVSRGVHLLLVSDGVRRPQPRLIEVGLNGAAIDLVPEPDAVAETLRRDATRYTTGRDADDLLQALAMIGAAEAAVVVVATWKRGAPALVAQRCMFAANSDVAVVCSSPVEVGWDGTAGKLDGAAHELVQLLGPLPTLPVQPTSAPIAILTEPSARPPTSSTPTRCQWCRNPWVWTGVGAAVLASAATVYLVTRDGTHPTPVVTINPDDF